MHGSIPFHLKNGATTKYFPFELIETKFHDFSLTFGGREVCPSKLQPQATSDH